jgi:hypothetical protein
VSELAVVTPQRATLADKIQFAKALAASDLLPRQYRGNPANLLFALEYAEALRVSPINAITSIHVIEGKPSASADLIAALVRRAGHKLRVTGDDEHAVAQIIRADDPGFVFEVVWTLKRAQLAGLTGKGVWKQYPAAMLRSRAITEVARAAASDALFGIVYTPEELGAPVQDDYELPQRAQPRPVDVTETVELPPDVVAEYRATPPVGDSPPPPQESPRRDDEPSPDTLPIPLEEEQPVVDDDGEPLATREQVRLLQVLFVKAGVRGAEARHRYLSHWLERPIESTNDCTVTEASATIERLQRQVELDA